MKVLKSQGLRKAFNINPNVREPWLMIFASPNRNAPRAAPALPVMRRLLPISRPNWRL
jgi:hypothetical protein